MKRRLAGLKKIHISKYTPPVAGAGEGTFATPEPILGAKSVSAELEYTEVKFFADDINDFSDYQFAGGSGELVLSGLQLIEYDKLFGSNHAAGVTTVNSTDVTPQLALMFERRKLGTTGLMKYVLYNVKFAPPAIEAATLEGDISEELITLPFTISEMVNGDVYRVVDSTIEGADVIANNWYENVYIPAAAEIKDLRLEDKKND